MVDFHTHFLPCIDDGSKSVEESLKMLHMETDEGVDTVVATPHFYLRLNSDVFFENRKKAYESVLGASKDADFKIPKILLGAEVRIERELCRYERLTDLCIEGTNVILLELPFGIWSEKWVFEEIFKIQSMYPDIVPVIAHINRYIKNSLDFRLLKPLFDMSVFFQINTDLYPYQRRIMAKLIKKGHAHVVGSDCHNTETRPPCLGKDLLLMEKKFGSDLIKVFDKNARGILNL